MYPRRTSTQESFPALPPAYANTKECVDMYNKRIAWLRDDHFLEDLERDSVDSDLLEEELEALQDEESPHTTRERVVKFLRSNPVQIILCVLVILDAGIVITQILLDLNSVRARLYKSQKSVDRLTSYLLTSRAADLQTYRGRDVNVILELLQWHDKQPSNTSDVTGTPPPGPGPAAQSAPRGRRAAAADWRTDRSRDPPAEGGGHRLRRGGRHRPRAAPGRVARAARGNGTEYLPGYCGNRSGLCELLAELQRRYQPHREHDVLHEVAHGLHFASISILGFLVCEDLMKIIAMGKEFFKHKIEIFDAVIILASFAFDLVFLNGVSGEEGEKAAAILIVLLLWRIMRVVDSIVVTTKQRQEFRIRLQKRAKKKAERRIDLLEEDKHRRIRQISALKDLCARSGINDHEIDSCTPRQPRRVSTTMCALSSVARLSVSMTMSMSSGLFSLLGNQDDQSGDVTPAPPAAPLRPPPASDTHRGSHCSTVTTSTSSDDTGICLDYHPRGDLSKNSSRRNSLEIDTGRRASCGDGGGRRASLTANMSDIEEESSSQKSSKSSYCSEHTHLEPANTSGVQIVIDSASDHNSHVTDQEDMFEQGHVDSPTDYRSAPRFFIEAPEEEDVDLSGDDDVTGDAAQAEQDPLLGDSGQSSVTLVVTPDCVTEPGYTSGGERVACDVTTSNPRAVSPEQRGVTCDSLGLTSDPGGGDSVPGATEGCVEMQITAPQGETLLRILKEQGTDL